MSAVRQIDIPEDARRRSTLAHVDYADAFLVAPGDARERTAEEWARAILGDAPAATRATLVSGWTGLGLKLDLLDSESVLGWPVRESTPDVLLLGAESRVGMPAELLLERRGDELLFCTLVEHGNAAARTLWAGIETLHVQVVRRLLARAAHN